MTNKSHTLESVPNSRTGEVTTADPTQENVVPSDVYYHCPYCDEKYEHEILTRVHITRSEGSQHVNKDGFSSEITINLISEKEGFIQSITRTESEKIDPTQLTIADISDGYPEQHKHIILVGAHYPYEETYTELTEIVNGIFEEKGIDTLSYSTIRRVIRGFYRPVEEDSNYKSDQTTRVIHSSNSTGDHNKVLADLTAKKQAIVIATLAHPEESKTDIASRVGVSISYPSQVHDQYNSLVDDLSERIQSDQAVEQVVATALPKKDITHLQASGFFEDIDVDVNRIHSHITNETGSTSQEDQEMSQRMGKDSMRQPTVEHHARRSTQQVETDIDHIPVEEVEHIQKQIEMYMEMLTGSEGVENQIEAYKHALNEIADEISELTGK